MKWKIGIAAAGTVGVALIAWVGFYFLGGGYVRDQHFAEAKKAAAELTREPESVKFRNFAYTYGLDDNFKKFDIICGEMNGKNLYGAYGGYVKFLYSRKVGPSIVTSDNGLDETYADCQTNGKK